MKSNDAEKTKLVELLKKQHAGRLIFECKKRVSLGAISELIERDFSNPLTDREVDKYIDVVNELFSGIDKDSKWLEIELEALEYFAKYYIGWAASDKSYLIKRVGIVKLLISKALSELK